jgi:hypothetical protein
MARQVVIYTVLSLIYSKYDIHGLNTFIGGNVCATSKQAQERGGGQSILYLVCGSTQREGILRRVAVSAISSSLL